MDDSLENLSAKSALSAEFGDWAPGRSGQPNIADFANLADTFGEIGRRARSNLNIFWNLFAKFA